MMNAEPHEHAESFGPLGRVPSAERLKAIARYGSGDITVDSFSGTLDEAKIALLCDVLLFHPNPIIRHEAAFVIGELDIDECMDRLYKSVKYDPSIVVKHEAIEALGKAKTPWRRFQNLRFLDRLAQPGYEEGVYHPDVVATIAETRKWLLGEVKAILC